MMMIIKGDIFLLSFLWFFLFAFLSKGEEEEEEKGKAGKEENISGYENHTCCVDNSVVLSCSIFIR